jgi:hypothetical protein
VLGFGNLAIIRLTAGGFDRFSVEPRGDLDRIVLRSPAVLCLSDPALAIPRGDGVGFWNAPVRGTMIGAMEP